MKVTEIVVSAGRTFNHPFESYSNLRPQVTYKAALEDGEDVAAATQELQAKAEKAVEDHKQNTIRMLVELHHLNEAQREAVDIQDKLKDLADRLDRIRNENPQLELPA